MVEVSAEDDDLMEQSLKILTLVMSPKKFKRKQKTKVSRISSKIPMKSRNRLKSSAFSSSQEEVQLSEESLTLESQVEAVLFASPKPLKASDVLEIVQDEDQPIQLSDVESVLQQLHNWYEERAGGFHLFYEKGIGYQFQTIPAASELMERMFSSRPRPLSRAALETLSIIAYRQPATRAEN